jgi:hypothetical protein
LPLERHPARLQQVEDCEHEGDEQQDLRVQRERQPWRSSNLHQHHHQSWRHLGKHHGERHD